MQNHAISDQELIGRYLAGHHPSLERLIRRHKNRVFAYILMIVKDKELSEDLFQDTFIKVINTIRSFQVFIEIFMMTRGGPLNSTLTTVFYLYDRAFTSFDLGYASAMAYVLFAVTLGASLVYVRILTQKEPT